MPPASCLHPSRYHQAKVLIAKLLRLKIRCKPRLYFLKMRQVRANGKNCHKTRLLLPSTAHLLTKARMRLVSWNVNGIRACLNKGFMQSLQQLDCEVMCLQETKAYQKQVKADFADWHAIWNSAERPGYSGTLILSKETPLEYSSGIGLAEHDNEGRVITAHFKHFTLVNVYTPNSGDELRRLDYRQQWDQAFGDYVASLAAKRPTLVCGDLNVAHREIDLARPASNHFSAGFTDEERRGFGKLLDRGFIDTFRNFYPQQSGAYSWWSYRAQARANNVGWRIDYFLASQSARDMLVDAKIHPDIHGSDHCPVSVDLKLPPQ